MKLLFYLIFYFRLEIAFDTFCKCYNLSESFKFQFSNVIIIKTNTFDYKKKFCIDQCIANNQL